MDLSDRSFFLLKKHSEWDKVESFTSFITTSQFAEFAASIGHLFTGPPRPQLFRTDTSPKDAASVGKMEILRLTVQNSEATALALQIWEDISVYLKTCYQEGVTVSYGKSQNLADEIVVGLIGWHALEVCAWVLALLVEQNSVFFFLDNSLTCAESKY